VEDGWKLEFYTATSGRCPVREYLDALPGREVAWLIHALYLLKASGLGLGAPHLRSVGGKLWELRVTGSLQHRVFYFAASGRTLVLLHAFAKKTPKTPSTELETAKRRMTEYLRR
jgi:phage-related protein